jgi:hypothetical protein
MNRVDEACDFDSTPAPLHSALSPPGAPHPHAGVSVCYCNEPGFGSELPPARGTDYLGVDPGLDGFLALVGADGRALDTAHVPLLPNDGGYDRRGMHGLLIAWKPRITLAMLEEQQAFPGSGPPCPACHRPKGQGAASTFTTGMGYGLWLMALDVAGIRYEEIRPVSWKKRMGIQPATGLEKNERTKEAKRLAVEKASSLFPGYDLRENVRCRVPHAGKCEALLLAEHARRTHAGAVA